MNRHQDFELEVEAYIEEFGVEKALDIIIKICRENAHDAKERREEVEANEWEYTADELGAVTVYAHSRR